MYANMCSKLRSAPEFFPSLFNASSNNIRVPFEALCDSIMFYYMRIDIVCIAESLCILIINTVEDIVLQIVN